MIAVKTTLSAKDKIPLHMHIPLDTPLSMTIEPSGICNLKCKYCLFSLPKQTIEAHRHIMQMMPDSIFDQIASDLSRFPRPIKNITFARLGEPLLNKKLPEMIERLKGGKLCEKTLVISNGIPLTGKLSQELVDAGLDRIKLSICGLSADDYMENCGTEVDFDDLVANIEYLYSIRGDMKVQIKILDKLLGDEIELGVERFHSIFGNICDEIDIECLYPMFGTEINYDELYFSGAQPPVNRYNSANKRKVCPMPFFKLIIAASGRVDYCYSMGITGGYLPYDSLYDIWHSSRRQETLLELLKSRHEGITKPCQTCGCFQDTDAEEDNLDDHAESLIKKIERDSKSCKLSVVSCQ